MKVSKLFVLAAIGLFFSTCLSAAPRGLPSSGSDIKYGSASGPKENVSVKGVSKSGAEVVFPIRADDLNAGVKDGQVCVSVLKADGNSWVETSPAGFAAPTHRSGNALVGVLSFPEAGAIYWIRVWATVVPGKCYGKVAYMWHPTWKNDPPEVQAQYPGYRASRKDGELGYEAVIYTDEGRAEPMPKDYSPRD